MRFDDLESVSSTGSKRGRDEVDEEADMTAMQNVSRVERREEGD
jgi:hypothetical protein